VIEPSEPVNTLARSLVSEAIRDSEPVRVLNNEDLTVRLEAEVSEPDRDLNNEVFSTKTEDKDSELLRVLNNEDLTVRLEAEVSEPLRDLKREFFSVKLEAEFSEALSPLTRPLISDPASENEPDPDLTIEDFLAKPETIFQVAVAVVEQERGLELQVNFPEFTLATMLPIVIAIEPVNVLMTEFFSARLEVEASEPLSDLRNEVFSAKVEARVREVLSDLRSDVC